MAPETNIVDCGFVPTPRKADAPGPVECDCTFVPPAVDPAVLPVDADVEETDQPEALKPAAKREKK